MYNHYYKSHIIIHNSFDIKQSSTENQQINKITHEII